MENVILSGDKMANIAVAYHYGHTTIAGAVETACITQARHILKILMGPCTEHEVPDDEFFPRLLGVDTNGYFYKHRKDCSDCMAEIQKEVNG
jgi:hypothetical protein